MCMKQIKFTVQIGFALNNSRYADVYLIFYMQIELYTNFRWAQNQVKRVSYTNISFKLLILLHQYINVNLLPHIIFKLQTS